MKNTLENILKTRKIKPTSMRILVLKELQNSRHAVSLNELESLFEQADKTTLYRTLKTFEKNKLVHSIDDGTGSVKYALCEENCDCQPEESHLHFHCSKCELTFCLNEIHLPQIKLPKNFIAKEMNLVVKGLCEDCSP